MLINSPISFRHFSMVIQFSVHFCFFVVRLDITPFISNFINLNLSICLLVNLAKDLSIALTFLKDQLFLSLICCKILLVVFYFVDLVLSLIVSCHLVF